MCDFCGHRYYRSTMVRMPSGMLACTDGSDCDKNDALTLERENAMAAGMGYPTPPSGGDW